MQGHSKELQAAAASFAAALPITSELADAADEVLTEIQTEIDATDAEIERFGREQVPGETGTEWRSLSDAEPTGHFLRIEPDGGRS